MMKIRSIPATHDWCVLADWYGADRVVFSGSLFACLGFVNREMKGN